MGSIFPLHISPESFLSALSVEKSYSLPEYLAVSTCVMSVHRLATMYSTCHNIRPTCQDLKSDMRNRIRG